MNRNPTKANPGPNAYDLQNSGPPMMKKSPYFSISSGRRTDFTNSSENLHRPGPNAYLPPDATS